MKDIARQHVYQMLQSQAWLTHVNLETVGSRYSLSVGQSRRSLGGGGWLLPPGEA